MTPNKIFTSMITLALVISACSAASPAAIPSTAETTRQPLSLAAPTLAAPTLTSTPEPSATPGEAAAQTAQPGSTPLTVGPDISNIPIGYNPLTGLPAADPASLKLPAVLISITNFPPSARPQSGLSFSPWVFEIYIAEGMTRYLATFYGDLPKSDSSSASPTGDVQIGPVRSGRLPYVYIRDFFQDSCLVYASATEQLRARLRGCAMVFGSDSKNINSAMLGISRLQKIAEQNQRPADNFNYSGNLFATNPPAQGLPASQINVFYSFLNQGQWQYSPDSGAYLKFDDFADGSGKFTPTKDRLTGQQLGFSNVVVLYTQHTVINPYIIDVKMEAGEKGRAVIFRDGQRFDAFWSTTSGPYEQSTGLRRPLRFVDASGNPFALKPGHTWVHIVTLPSEILDQGAGVWQMRFYAPAGAK
jgi:hypothetical protein